MKKLIFAAMAALAITGCSQNEEFEAQGQNNEIQIGTIVKKTTKAAVTDNTNFVDFKLHSYIVDATSIATTGLGTAYMDGVQYAGKKGEWTTIDQTKYYWPVSAKMQFFAYPSKAINYATPETGYPTFNFTIDAGAEQTDLVVAHHVDVIKPDDNILTLDFKHILTRINFSYIPGDATYNYKVNSITIKGVQGGVATYTYGVDKGSWSAGADINVDYVYSVKGEPEAVGDVFALDTENGSLMLLPQSVASKVIAINYTVTKNNIEYFKGDKTVTLPAGATWGIGQNIRYKLTLPMGGEQIKVDTDVTGWDAEATPESPVL